MPVPFDFRTDTPHRRDPDTHSPTLRQYHKLLWSKALPDGALFDLNDAKRAVSRTNALEQRQQAR